MKTNLDKLFKTDKDAEVHGVWLEFTETISVKVARFGGLNSIKVKASLAKHYKPNLTLSPEKERETLISVFVDSVVLDWKGIEIDGVPTPFSKDVAVKLFSELPDFFDKVMTYSQDQTNFREDLGND